MNLTDEQLIEIYHIVFTQTHSHGFMTAEVNDLLFQPDYVFLDTPNKDWDTNLNIYLHQIGYDKSLLKINSHLSKIEWIKSKIN